LLRDFFRSQVPAPWPALTDRATVVRSDRIHAIRVTTGPMNRATTSISFLRWSRLTLAAAIALLVIGYWSLAGNFPLRPPDPGATMNSIPDIGHRMRGKVIEKTRHGRDAVLEWKQSPDGLFMRIEEKNSPMR
jgi:hypothetical protein